MDRRTFLAGTGAVLLVAPLAAEAKLEPKVPKIGAINFASPPVGTPNAGLLWGPMRKLGRVEEQNVVVERRSDVTAFLRSSPWPRN